MVRGVLRRTKAWDMHFYTTQVFQKSVACMKKSERPDEIWFVYIWSSKLYVRYHGNCICGRDYPLPLKLIFENISLKVEQKTTVACYQTCYTNSTEGTVHWSIWKNQQPPGLLDAKNHTYWIATKHYARYRTNTNKLTFFQKVLVFSDGKQSIKPCVIVLFGILLLPWHNQFSRAWSAVQGIKVTCSWSAHLLNGI